ncbi:hypothetical protein GPECTOR_11g202 [Gonium pectorale]|uniref:Guanylate cyclase domain-containing protein n=1 Tax=Gonium pectorale TaxID=33097 RepID=A0A150GPU7_GONPE|nr:hypothetical protein GPECTOR_11g202 [Gonium pectorale]|eukprot:KXZ51758.1 hypothetical protein GPECTOR_11g202 [Gonium pectorale]
MLNGCSGRAPRAASQRAVGFASGAVPMSPSLSNADVSRRASAMYDTLRTSTFAMGLLDSAARGDAMSTGGGPPDAAAPAARAPLLRSGSSLAPRPAAGALSASFTSRAVNFAASLRTSPIIANNESMSTGSFAWETVPSDLNTAADLYLSARSTAVINVGRATVDRQPPAIELHPMAEDSATMALSKEALADGADLGRAATAADGPTSHRPTAAAAAAGEAGGCAALEAWHEVWATRTRCHASGQSVMVLLQHDVTAKVVAERHVMMVMDAGHRLLEQIFPRHVLQHMAESFTRAGAAVGAAAGSYSPQLAQNDIRRLRMPALQDCNALATSHPQVTLLFADIKGFTPMCGELEPSAVMRMLNELFSRFDDLLDTFGVETIGDCYFVAGGLVQEDEDGMAVVRDDKDPLHAHKVFMFAKAMLRAAQEVRVPTTGESVSLRIGMHTGPVVSGVVGKRMPRFCLFGDTVNTASRMESTGTPGAIHASQATYELLRHEAWAPTGGLEVKGKGRMQTYLWSPEGSPVAGCDFQFAGFSTAVRASTVAMFCGGAGADGAGACTAVPGADLAPGPCGAGDTLEERDPSDDAVDGGTAASVKLIQLLFGSRHDVRSSAKAGTVA